MEFYHSIAQYYDEIFPLNVSQPGFIQSICKKNTEAKILDIGCGTGNLAISLANTNYEVTGIDLDEDMLQIAIEKSRNSAKRPEFKIADMLAIGKYFVNDSFDIISCFGNTLVHLQSKEDIGLFFSGAGKLLKRNGSLLIQIINYDRILDHSIPNLPTIENEAIRFERNYEYIASSGYINFETILTVKASDEIIRNKVRLLPLRRTEIEDMLSAAGFNTEGIYGNFKMEEFDKNSIPLIVAASFHG